MKIDPGKLQNIGRSGIERVGGKGIEQTGGVESGGAVTGSVSTDRLALSQRAEEMKLARAAMAETPEVRADRVESLKAQIEAGTYQVNSSDVAERILNSRS